MLVELTADGRRLWEKAIGTQAEKEALLASAPNKAEPQQLSGLLRRVMVELEARGVEK